MKRGIAYRVLGTLSQIYNSKRNPHTRAGPPVCEERWNFDLKQSGSALDECLESTREIKERRSN